jgi:archaellum component FlaC
LGGKALKRSAVTITFLVAVALLGGALGCGGVESQARGYLEAAHEEGLKVTKNIDKLGKITATVKPGNIEAIRKLYIEFVGQIGAVNASAEKTKDQYEKVLKLEDVAKYKEFADLQIRALDELMKEMGLVGELYTLYNKVDEDNAAGKPIDETAVNNRTKDLIVEIGKADEEIAGIKKDAADIGDELNLPFLKEKK